MVKSRHRQTFVADDQEDLKLQSRIFLITFVLMVLFLITLYVPVPIFLPIIIAIILLGCTIFCRQKYKDFYRFRDRGQRTWCVTISMYISLILTILCAYYFAKDGSLTMDYALVFLFGFMFFTFMVYRTLSPSMVVGNLRQRIKQ